MKKEDFQRLISVGQETKSEADPYVEMNMKRPGKVPYAESRKSVLPWIVVFSIVLLPMSASYVYSSELTFVDKTVEAGLSYAPSPSYGVSWGDFNNDSLADLLIKNHNTSIPSL